MSVATNRMLAFVEFLSKKYEIEVFCLNQEEGEKKHSENVRLFYSSSNKLFDIFKNNAIDSALKHKIKTGINVIISFFVKNPLNKWKKATLNKLKERHQLKAFDYIISSYSPQETHLVAIDFCKKHPNIPWIADMRDEMSKNPNLNASQQDALMQIEKEINQYASAITSVSEPILNDFKTLCPNITYFEEIRNGFNHNFKRDVSQFVKNEVFTLGYFGSFYGGRKPNFLFEALSNLLKNEAGFDFRFEIIGAHKNFTIPTDLQEKVTILPNLEYEKAIEYMAQLDLNVQMHPRSKQKGVFTGKLFDYISVQKPVLALVDKDDVAAQLVNDFGCGYVAEFAEVGEIEIQVKQAFSDWKQDKIKFASDEDRNSLHRKFQVEKLIKLIESIH